MTPLDAAPSKPAVVQLTADERRIFVRKLARAALSAALDDADDLRDDRAAKPRAER